MPTYYSIDGTGLNVDMPFSIDFDVKEEQFSPDIEAMVSPELDVKFDPSLFDSLMNVDPTNDVEEWSNDVLCSLPDLPPSPDGTQLEFSCFDSQLVSPSSSPSSMVSSDSSQSSFDVKFSLETPPISPPDPLIVTNGQNLVQQTGIKKSPVLKINPKNVQIISVSGGFKPVGKSTPVVLPKDVLDKVIQMKKESEQDTQTLPTVHQNGMVGKRRRELAVRPEGLSPRVPQSTVTITQSPLSITSPIVTVAQSQPLLLSSTPSQQTRKDYALKALKKQQRMIKNRESACLSRKKKKEYVQTLESKVNQLEVENEKLTQENEMLKYRIKELESLSFSSPFKSPMSSNLKKSVAFLAVVFMVSINVGSMGLLPRESAFEGQFSRSTGPRRVGRALLWDDSPVDNITSSSSLPTCPLYVNQTESLRIDKELRQWIDDERGKTSQYRNVSWRKPVPTKPSLRRIILHSPPARQLKRENVKSGGEVEVWRFPPSLLHQDDMFHYVVSLSKEHLLFPAKQTNSTLRPRMSLVLPTAPLNESLAMNGTVPMMQIDCEVLATRSLLLTEQDIKLLQPKQVTPQQGRQNSTQGGYRETGYKPYFLKSKTSADFDQNFDSFVSEKAYRQPNMFT